MALLKPFSDSHGRIPFELVRKEINKVEQQIRDQVCAFDPQVEPYIDYICNTSGKRIRPALSILTAGAIGNISDNNIKIGVILELIHMATLVHDDIIDGADTRRKIPTANAKWGNSLAVLLGDALFSHSLLLATEFGSIDICRKVGQASREVCQGEVMQTQRRFDTNLTKDDYFKIIGMKTGALFAAAAGISASLSGADDNVENELSSYGMKLGIAYQIYDDCLDLIGSEAHAGKTLGTDLEKGKLTLPLLTLLESATPAQRHQIEINMKENHPMEFEAIFGTEAYSQAVQAALNTASTMLSDARQALTCLSDNKYTSGLIDITRYLDGLLAKCQAS